MVVVHYQVSHVVVLRQHGVFISILQVCALQAATYVHNSVAVDEGIDAAQCEIFPPFKLLDQHDEVGNRA